MATPTGISNSATLPGLCPTEEVLSTLWNEVLRRKAIFLPTDNFFASGGNTLTAARLQRRIEDEFPVVLPSGTVNSSPTLRELSSTVDRAVEACIAAYRRLMADAPPPELGELFERGMPDAPGIVGSPEFIAHVQKMTACRSKPGDAFDPDKLEGPTTHSSRPRKNMRATRGSRSNT